MLARNGNGQIARRAFAGDFIPRAATARERGRHAALGRLLARLGLGHQVGKGTCGASHEQLFKQVN